MVSFRPLELEIGMGHLLSGASGSHNTHSWDVRVDQVSTQLVGRHEALHDRLLYETPYGTTQVVFKRLAMFSKNSAVITRANLWSEVLLNNSRDSHERFATYLSIKETAIEKHNELLSIHPPRYQQYFQDLALAVDKVFKSSYLQFLVGLTVIEICFSSKLQERLCHWDLNYPFDVQRNDLPDSRFQDLINLCTENQFGDLLRYLEENWYKSFNYGIPQNFNINRETDWLKLDLGTSHRLDSILQNLIRIRLYEISSCLWPSLPLKEWLSIRQQFIERVSLVTNVDLKLIVPHNKDSEEKVLERQSRAANASIINTNPLLDAQLDFLPEDFDISQLLDLHADSKFLITYQTQNPFFIFFFYTFNSGNKTTRCLLHHRQVLRLLELNRLSAASIGFVPSFYDGIIVRRQDIGGRNFNDFYEDVLSYHTIKTASKVSRFNLSTLFWYMDGNVLNWYESLKSNGSIEAMKLYLEPTTLSMPKWLEQISEIQTINTQRLIEDVPTLPYSMLILRCKSLAGLFCRILSSAASTQLAMIFMRDFNKSLVAIPLQEREEIANVGINVAGQILSTWKII